MNADGFSARWLRLRAPFDAAAANRPAAAALAGRFATVLRFRRGDRAIRLLDLGGGAGANVCRLAPRIAGDQIWQVVDDDADLLAEVDATIAEWAESCNGRVHAVADGVTLATDARSVTVLRRRYDLRYGLSGLPLAETDGVVAASLLDLVSAEWLDHAVAVLRANALPMLATLVFDGTLEWRPASPVDAKVAAAFRGDMRRDKGFGAALGDAAPGRVRAAFEAHGYAVRQSPSDWRVDPGDAAMHRAMLSFIVPAATRHPPAGAGASHWADEVAEWASAKHRRIAAHALRLRVGHGDTLALM